MLDNQTVDFVMAYLQTKAIYVEKQQLLKALELGVHVAQNNLVANFTWAQIPFSIRWYPNLDTIRVGLLYDDEWFCVHQYPDETVIEF